MNYATQYLSDDDRDNFENIRRKFDMDILDAVLAKEWSDTSK